METQNGGLGSGRELVLRTMYLDRGVLGATCRDPRCAGDGATGEDGEGRWRAQRRPAPDNHRFVFQDVRRNVLFYTAFGLIRL